MKIKSEVVDRIIHAADDEGLEGEVRDRYITFCINWHEAEGGLFLGGYANEWARRFKRGVEYDCADLMTATYIPYRK